MKASRSRSRGTRFVAFHPERDQVNDPPAYPVDRYENAEGGVLPTFWLGQVLE